MSTRNSASTELTVTPTLLREWALPRSGDTKHDRGHLLIVGGAASTPGAALLAGVAALRVGAGVLALAVEQSVAPVLAVAVPEASVLGLDFANLETNDQLKELVVVADALLVGPGLDDPRTTRQLLRAAAEPFSASIVLDAFALGVLGNGEQAVHRSTLPADLVLTPNPDEAKRLLASSPSVETDDRAAIAEELARRYNAVVVYQRHIADTEGGHWFVPGGNSGLGTSGSGDVLAGAITGLLARGASASQAACWATYLHVTAGDRLAERIGPLGYLARELATCFPTLLAEVEFDRSA